MTDGSDREFGDWFGQTFGAPFPIRLEEPLVLLRERIWISPALARLAGGPLPVPMTANCAEPPGDYCMAGFWGHSVNSYAFYLLERRDSHRRFFRLPFGGAYGDPQRDTGRVVRFLGGYQAFRERWIGRLKSSTLVHEMGKGFARITLTNGVQVTLDDPLGEEPDGFWQRLADQIPLQESADRA